MRNSNTFRSGLLRAGVVLGLLFGGFCAHAVDGSRSMAQYLRQRWEAAQGMPGMVNAMAQTPDGYLWIGTDSGLYRFDGRGFRLMRADAADIGSIDHVRALAADSDGSLWIWMQSTSLLRYAHGAFQRAGGASWDAMRITGMSRANGPNHEGILLSTLSRGIVHLTAGRLEQLGQFRGTLAISVAQTSEGRVWLGTRDRGLMMLNNGGFQPVAGALPDQKMNTLLPGPDGQLWIGTDNGLALWDGKQLVPKTFPAPLDHAQILSLVLDRDGNLWAGTSQGLVRYNAHAKAATAEVLPAAGGEPQRPVTAVLEDREGNLWFGGPRGIERVRDSTFAAYMGPPDVAGAVFVDADHRVWFAPRTGGVAWYRDGVRHAVVADGLDNDTVYSITGSGDSLWLGRRFGGVTHLVMEGDHAKATTVPLRTGALSHVVFAEKADASGGVWVGTLTGGVYHLAAGMMVQYTRADGLLAGSVSAIENDLDGRVYVGTSSGLSELFRGHWQTYNQMAGLPMGEVTALFEDSGGVLWVGTGIGLGYLTNNGLAATARERTLFHERILGIAEDRAGWLWMTTPGHVFKVRRSSLLANHVTDADVRVFDEADGLRSVGSVRRSQPVVSDNDGMIWIATPGGLMMAHPESEGREALPALPHVEQMVVDGTSMPTPEGNGAAESTVSAAAQKRIAFNFTGLSFRVPERVRYRYRLDGFDRGWSEPTAETQAIYTNLSPGRYDFRVMASDSDGQWSPLVARTAIRILPRFWQTWWFRAVLVLLTAFAVLFFYRLRMRAMVLSSNRMLEERLTERTRIAQELHDTLLQGFFSASMQLRVVADNVEPGSAARSQLDRILALMGKVLDQGRDAVKGLRSSAEDSVWLEDACRTMARDQAGEEDVAYDVTVEGNVRELRHGVQAEVTRIVQEALGNAMRHSHATRIDVMIRYQPQALRVAVRDNGVGVPAQILTHGREGHWGLAGMRERAETIGGSLEVTSVLESGTSVELAVPANSAYRRYMKNGLLNWLIEVYRARRTAPHL